MSPASLRAQSWARQVWLLQKRGISGRTATGVNRRRSFPENQQIPRDAHCDERRHGQKNRNRQHRRESHVLLVQNSLQLPVAAVGVIAKLLENLRAGG